MNTIWRTENDHLACRWSELPQRPYNAGWMHEAATIGVKPRVPCFLDFRRLSGLGGRRWFEWRSFEPKPECGR
jgi:hypothetical protein